VAPSEPAQAKTVRANRPRSTALIDILAEETVSGWYLKGAKFPTERQLQARSQGVGHHLRSQ